MSYEMVKKLHGALTIDALHIKLKIDNNIVRAAKNTDSLDCFFDLKCDSESFKEFSLNKYPNATFNLGDFNLIIDKKYYRRKTHRNCYFVKYKDELLGHLSWSAYNGEYDKGELKALDIDNEMFYKYKPLDLYSIVYLLMSQFGLKLNNIEMYDLAIDSNFDVIKKLEYYYSKPEKYYFKCYNRLDEVLDTIISKKRATLIGVGVRFKHKNESLKIYDKSKEIEKSKKHYITKYLTNKGLDVSKPIYRREIHITGNSIYRNKINFTLYDLFSEPFMNELFDVYWEKFIDFRRIDKSKRITRYKKIDILKVN